MVGGHKGAAEPDKYSDGGNGVSNEPPADALPRLVMPSRERVRGYMVPVPD